MKMLLILLFCVAAEAKVYLSNAATLNIQLSAPTEMGMPSWRQGMAAGEWREIAGTALSNAPIAVNTYAAGAGQSGPQAKLDAWCGLGIDSRDSSLYSAANGGHADYAGNEVDQIRLRDDIPRWKEIKASTPVNQLLDASHYADGRPTSRHSYYGVVVNELRNRVMLLGGSAWKIGFGIDHLDGFNLATNEWDPALTYPRLGDSTVGAATVEVKSSGDIYTFVNFNVFQWSQSTNQWTKKLSNTSLYGQYAASALDTKRNRILVVGGNASDHGVYDLKTNQVTTVSLSGLGFNQSQSGMVYDPQLDAFLIRTESAGGEILKVHPETWSVEKLAVSGGNQIVAATNGVWRKFLYVPALKGVVYAPRYNSNLWFLRTN